MTRPRSPVGRRSLQARLALLYAVGIFAAGIMAVIVAAIGLADLGSTVAVPGGTSAAPEPTGGVGLRQLLVGAATAVALLIPVSLGAGWLVAGQVLTPLRAITATAAAISAGNLHQRLDLGEPVDELTELGFILDDLFARLQASFDAQRHFVANASHELRTPLAGLQTLLEVTLADPDPDVAALRSACQEALALGAHQERLLHALLELATSERGPTRREAIDLSQAARRVLTSRRGEAAERGVELREDLAPAVTAGDPRLVESLVANLVDNAIRHNHPDGHVRVSTTMSGTYATLTITNSGPVVPGDQLQRLVQPFQRLAPDRQGRGDGYGLGLAIVDAVARAHHAALTTSAQPDGGLLVAVRFPAEREVLVR
jgi:signal transduction histidine kinase